MAFCRRAGERRQKARTCLTSQSRSPLATGAAITPGGCRARNAFPEGFGGPLAYSRGPNFAAAKLENLTLGESARAANFGTAVRYTTATLVSHWACQTAALARAHESLFQNYVVSAVLRNERNVPEYVFAISAGAFPVVTEIFLRRRCPARMKGGRSISCS